jgi:hypothetical protein
MATRIGGAGWAKTCDFATREFLDDEFLHLYRKAELADPGCQWLVPWCQEDDLYPDRPPRVEVVARLVKAIEFCPRCDGCYRRGQAWEPGGLVEDGAGRLGGITSVRGAPSHGGGRWRCRARLPDG